MPRLILAVVFLALTIDVQGRQAPASSGYLTPPKTIVEILDAEPLPGTLLSPVAKTIALSRRKPMPTIGEVAEPMLRLAGLLVFAGEAIGEDDIFARGAAIRERLEHDVVATLRSRRAVP